MAVSDPRRVSHPELGGLLDLQHDPALQPADRPRPWTYSKCRCDIRGRDCPVHDPVLAYDGDQ